MGKAFKYQLINQNPIFATFLSFQDFNNTLHIKVKMSYKLNLKALTFFLSNIFMMIIQPSFPYFTNFEVNFNNL